MILEIEKVTPNVPMPEYKTSGSAAFDLINNGFYVCLAPSEIKVIPTGIKVKLPQGTAGFVMPRSGRSIGGLTVNNSPGLIDSDYRNEIMVIAINTGNDLITIEHGERFAQFMVVPYIKPELSLVDKLSEDDFDNERGLGGLGHTGNL